MAMRRWMSTTPRDSRGTCGRPPREASQASCQGTHGRLPRGPRSEPAAALPRDMRSPSKRSFPSFLPTGPAVALLRSPCKRDAPSRSRGTLGRPPREASQAPCQWDPRSPFRGIRGRPPEGPAVALQEQLSKLPVMGDPRSPSGGTQGRHSESPATEASQASHG